MNMDYELYYSVFLSVKAFKIIQFVEKLVFMITVVIGTLRGTLHDFLPISR